jgi:membrane-bound serine protease (ClpP class)
MRLNPRFQLSPLFALLGLLLSPLAGIAQEPDPLKANPGAAAVAKAAEKEERPAGPVARYITVSHPVNETIFTRVRNSLVKLQNIAEQEDREAFLILEIERGSSMFGQVHDLAKELTSFSYSKVRTVAWIPEHDEGRPLDGYAAVLALACREIVMHPDAEFGDIGRGKSVDTDEKRLIINMVEKRYNPDINGALAAGFLDPSEIVRRVKIETKKNGQVATELRIVTADEHRQLQDSNVPILDVESIKDEGDPLLLSGDRARDLGILVKQTANDRSALPDIYKFDRKYLREDATGGEIPTARLIKVEGTVSAFMQEFVEREIRRAVAADANLIVFEINSPGGELFASKAIADAIAELDPKKHRTVAYVPEMAISGGAMIAFGCDEIYLAPGANIGDIIPLSMKEGGWAEHAPEKILSMLREMLNELAEKKGRPPALLEAMADKDLVVYQVTHIQTQAKSYMSEQEFEAEAGIWEKGPVVPETRKGVALTINGERAYELGLGEEPVNDFRELKQRVGIPAKQVIPAASQTWVDTLVVVLKHPAATFLLFMVGLICIYLEVYTMTGFFGIGAALCFSIFFWSRFLGGTAGWLEIVLFVFGAGLIALEIFVIPGFGIFGITGGLAVVFSIILASQTFVIPSTSEQLAQLSRTMGTLSGSIVAVVFLALFAGGFIRRIPGVRNLILAPAADDESGPMLDPTLAGESPVNLIDQDPALLSKQGVAFSTLRPAGRAQIEGQLIDVVSDGEFIESGTPIEVIEVARNKVVVRPVG